MNNIDEPIFEAEFNPDKIRSDANPDLAAQIRQLISGQSFGILCTQGQRQPYGSLIAYAFTEDLKHFFFKTQIATRKFKLLSECQRVALVVDSRCQHREDLTSVAAATITGKAIHIETGEEYQKGVNLLRNRHPYIAHFLEAESTALFRIDVVRYFHVGRFQEVSQWIP